MVRRTRQVTAVITATCLAAFAAPAPAPAAPAPARWHQVAELKGSDVVADDSFGDGVAISGGTVVVGAPYHADWRGRAYVFEDGAGGWHQVAELAASDASEDEEFGEPVAISGRDIVVGTYDGSEAYVFSQGPAGWHQVVLAKGTDSFATDFGYAVGISDGTAVVGGGWYASVYSAADDWHLVAKLRPSGLGLDSEFDRAVAISGGTIVVGAPEASPPETGRAYLYTRTATGWHQTAEMKGPAGDTDYGISVATSGSTVAIGDGSVVDVLTEAASGWHQTAQLNDGTPSALGPEANLAVSGGTIVSGTYGDPAVVFQCSSAGWHQVAALMGRDLAYSTSLGWAGDFAADQGETAISGDTVVIGADEAANSAGRAYIFTSTG